MLTFSRVFEFAWTIAPIAGGGPNRANSGPKQFKVPAEYGAYSVRYVKHKPEEGAVCVYIQKAKLTTDGGTPTPAGPAGFARRLPISTRGASCLTKSWTARRSGWSIGMPMDRVDVLFPLFGSQ